MCVRRFRSNSVLDILFLRDTNLFTAAAREHVRCDPRANPTDPPLGLRSDRPDPPSGLRSSAAADRTPPAVGRSALGAQTANSACSLQCDARIKRMDVLAPAEGLPPHITQFVHGTRILLLARVGVYRRFVNGTASATRAPCYIFRRQ